ncbi:hypothetical protein [Pseudonocardia sp.]|uniref:hypothetical protein n=1 Tax=Pseudonocardia sp. TaxID=60912 RepID=UPI003D09C7EF
MITDRLPLRILTRPAPPRATPFAGSAFTAWSIAFAIGTLFHLWTSASQDSSFGPVVAFGAFAVLLRPSAPARLMLLLALLVAEAVTWLPELSNHQMVVAVLGLGLVPWWLVTAWRRPAVAYDPAALYDRIGPYLRVGFLVMWASAAFAKLNTGFLDLAHTCAAWVLGSVPGVTVPAFAVPLVIGGTLAAELAVPLLLLTHRTRPCAVVLGLGFHLVSAWAGHASFSGFAWSFYLLFLPPAMLARALVLARAAAPARTRRVLAAAAAGPWWIALAPGAAWLLGWWLLPDVLAGPARRFDLVLYTAWAAACGVLLFRLRDHWLRAPGPVAGLRVRQPLLLVALAVLLVSVASPYLGLKTRGSLTMFSNLRTEPGHWNHLVVPEEARLFGWQDGEVRYLGSDDAALDRTIAKQGTQLVLLDLRLIVREHPDATVRYVLDGTERVAGPVRTDPVLGGPVTAAQSWFGALRSSPSPAACLQ